MIGKTKSKRCGLFFPVARMHRYFKKLLHKGFRLSEGAPIYQAAVIEYLTGWL